VTDLPPRARGARALYILGDLFEAWIGDDDPDPDKRRVVAALQSLTATGVPCYVMHGNRDFLLGRRFLGETGAQILEDGALVEIEGERVLLMHGDLLCTDDHSYQRLRRIVRNPLLQWIVRHLSLASRQSLAARMRAGSQMHTQSTAPEIMDVNDAAVRAAFHRTGVRTLIHGHTHRPAIHDLEVDGRPRRRIVLGDWHQHGSVLEWQSGDARLEVLPR
jgi:UDP-2,3-diacylglucosamine hydrolase